MQIIIPGRIIAFALLPVVIVFMAFQQMCLSITNYYHHIMKSKHAIFQADHHAKNFHITNQQISNMDMLLKMFLNLPKLTKSEYY